MNLNNEELDMIAEALNTLLQGQFTSKKRRKAMEALADKIVGNQEAEQDDD